MYLKPLPSSPIRLSSGILKLSKKTSVVEWFIIVLIGFILKPFFFASCISNKKTDKPSVFLLTWFSGVVRANNNIKSECSARLVQIFCPLIIYSSPSLIAVVLKLVVSVPLVGSVTPKACNLSVPSAIFGKYSCFCSGEPCLRTVPIVYICA